MPIFRFGAFTFDASSHELRNAGALIKLRPKTSILLGILIAHRDTPLSQQQLLQRVWPNTHADSNNLFQAISELRRAFKPINPIRTIPNQGYVWQAPLRRKPRWIPATVAACLLVLATVLLTLPGTSQHSSTATLPPAYRAFFAGMDFLDERNPAAASVQFELAIAENPRFSEAYLMLAQSLMQAEQPEQARTVLDQLLQQQQGGGDQYAEMTAMDMMGQVNEMAGESEPALNWTRQAIDHARASGYICAAHDLNARLIDVERLVMKNPTSEPDNSVTHLPSLAQTAPERCDNIPPRLKSSAINDCLPNIHSYASRDQHLRRSFKIS